MGFSSHEIYMILRARNEASGVLQRLARQLTNDHKNQMDRYKEQLAGFAAQNDALRVNSSNVMSNARTLTMAAREKVDAERDVIRGIKDRVSNYDIGFKKEMQNLATAKAERAGYITSLGAESRELMRNNAIARENYKTQIDGIKSLKTSNSDLYTQAATALRKNRDEAIAANDAKRRAIGESIDELRRENLVIDENARRVAKNATVYKNRADKSIRASQDIINGHQDEITAIDRTAKKAVEANNVQIASNKKSMASIRESMDLHQQHLNRLEGLGQIYMMTGTAAVVAGGLMVSAFVNAGKAAADYQTAAALTFTQVDRDAQGHALVTQKAILDMGKRVAREWPVEFGSIQPALYDIFSSMDIASEKVAQNMVDNIAKAAVAGAVSMEVAGKGVIEVINAWKLPMTDATNAVTGLTEAQSTLNRVNDVAFTLVKEGVGSYEQFSNSIGRSIPSAVKAGATYEDMAGGLAFLTRMGMSTTMASTSLGRAFDLISNPKFESNMKKYGLTTRDASGNFKSMVQITNDLKGHLEGMSEGQTADFLKNVTLGAGGTVQAMRFLNHAVLDGKGILDETTGALIGFVDEMDLDPSRIGLFEKLTADMYNAKGAADIAYETMANTPTAKIQEMSNQFDIFKITIGETVLQAIVPLVEFITILMDRFNMLSPEIQRVIVIVGMVVAGLLVFGGVVMLAVGFFLMLQAAAVAAGMALGTVILIGAGIVAAFLAVIAVIVAVVYFWPQISAAAQGAWEAIVATWGTFTEWFMGIWNGAVSAVTSWANNSITAAQTFWNDLVNWFTNIPTMAQAAWDGMVASVTAFFVNAGAVVTGGISVITGMFTDTSNVWTAPFRNTWAIISETTKAVFESIRVIIAGVFLIIVGIFTGNGKLIQDAWNGMGNKLKEIWSKAWDNIKDVLDKSKQVISDAISKLVSDVGRWFNDMKNNVGNTLSQWGSNVSQKVHEVVTYFQQLPGKVIAAVVSLGTSLASQANAWFGSLGAAVSSGIAKVVGFMQTLPGRIISAISGLAGQMASVGSNIMNSLAGGIAAAAGRAATAAINAVKGAIDAAKRLLGIASPSKVFTQFGVFSGEGLAIGFTKMRGTVRSASERMVEAAINSVEIPVTASVVSAGASSRSIGAQQIAAMATTMGGGQEINIDVHTQEIDPVKHAADLGYLVGSKLGW